MLHFDMQGFPQKGGRDKVPFKMLIKCFDVGSKRILLLMTLVNNVPTNTFNVINHAQLPVTAL